MTGIVAPSRLRWLALAAAALIGCGIILLVCDRHLGQILGSYLGGLLLASVALELGSFNIRLAARYAPNLTMVVALGSYLTTALVMALVLAASSPRVVSGPAMALGLCIGLTIWLTALLCASWVRTEHPVKPVNIRAQDETTSRF